MCNHAQASTGKSGSAVCRQPELSMLKGGWQWWQWKRGPMKMTSKDPSVMLQRAALRQRF